MTEAITNQNTLAESRKLMIDGVHASSDRIEVPRGPETHLPLYGLEFTRVDNANLGVGQTLKVIVEADEELFGVIEVATAGEEKPAYVLSRLSPRDGERATVMGALTSTPLELGRRDMEINRDMTDVSDGMSKKHAAVSIVDGVLVVKDHNSTNGTSILASKPKGARPATMWTHEHFGRWAPQTKDVKHEVSKKSEVVASVGSVVMAEAAGREAMRPPVHMVNKQDANLGPMITPAPREGRRRAKEVAPTAEQLEADSRDVQTARDVILGMRWEGDTANRYYAKETTKVDLATVVAATRSGIDTCARAVGDLAQVYASEVWAPTMYSDLREMTLWLNDVLQRQTGQAIEPGYNTQMIGAGAELVDWFGRTLHAYSDELSTLTESDPARTAQMLEDGYGILLRTRMLMYRQVDKPKYAGTKQYLHLPLDHPQHPNNRRG